jgi:hypothetical protein
MLTFFPPMCNERAAFRRQHEEEGSGRNESVEDNDEHSDDDEEEDSEHTFAGGEDAEDESGDKEETHDDSPCLIGVERSSTHIFALAHKANISSDSAHRPQIQRSARETFRVSMEIGIVAGCSLIQQTRTSVPEKYTKHP